MFVTISIQTCNQAGALKTALRSLVDLECPAGVDYEVLVVDNNSTDRTAQVIREFAGTFGPRLRAVHEPRQGLSHARNRAVAEARGEVICFMDDDAVADGRWLAGHARAYLADEQAVAVGGPIMLRWPEGRTRPAWLSPSLDYYVSALNFGPDRQLMHYPRHPYGCNMSVRRTVALEVGGFSGQLGRKGASLLSNEERHFFYKIGQYGGRVLYEPGTLVYHMVPRERLSKKFFVKRAYAQGISDILFDQETIQDEVSCRRWIGLFLGDVRMLGVVSIKGVMKWLMGCDPAACFVHVTQAAYAAGRVAASVRTLMPGRRIGKPGPCGAC